MGNTLNGKINRLYELRGYSAYEVAVLEEFEGTKEEWLASLVGPQGPQGDRGNSGVYIGSGDMPADCSVQIDPNGDALTVEEIAADAIDDNAVSSTKTWSSEKISDFVGEITPEKIGAATTGYVDEVTENCVFADDMESVLYDNMEFITQGVISALPVYNGEVV